MFSAGHINSDGASPKHARLGAVLSAVDELRLAQVLCNAAVIWTLALRELVFGGMWLLSAAKTGLTSSLALVALRWKRERFRGLARATSLPARTEEGRLLYAALKIRSRYRRPPRGHVLWAADVHDSLNRPSGCAGG